jgi:PEP-CTERM motif
MQPVLEDVFEADTQTGPISTPPPMPRHVPVRADLGLRRNLMRRRPILLALAGVLIAAMASGTPSHAGSTRVTAQAILSPFGPTETVSAVDVTFTTAAEPFTGLNLIIPPNATGSTISSSAAIVTVSPSAAANFAYQFFGEVIIQFTFVVPLDITAAQADVKALSNVFVTSTGGHAGMVTLSFASVPEPTSWTMLGIGLVGLSAFGRSFRRATTARSGRGRGDSY